MMSNDDGITLDTPDEINMFSILSARGRLRLMLAGLQDRCPRLVCYHLAHQTGFDAKPQTRWTLAKKKALLEHVNAWIDEQRAKRIQEYEDVARL